MTNRNTNLYKMYAPSPRAVCCIASVQNIDYHELLKQICFHLCDMHLSDRPMVFKIIYSASKVRTFFQPFQEHLILTVTELMLKI